jgi:hypothetical protein
MSNFKAWAKDVSLRAVKTAAQSAGAVITANTAGLTHVPFVTVVDVAGLAALICVLQNLSNLKVPDPAVPAPLEAVFTTTTGTVVTGPPVFTQTSDAPAPAAVDPTQPAPLPGGVGPGWLAGYGDTSSSSSSHPPKEGPNT